MDSEEKMELLMSAWYMYAMDTKKGYPDFITRLSQHIKNGADINKEYHGDTFLQRAIDICDIKLIQYLLNNGAKVTLTETAMCKERIENYVEIFELLIPVKN
jgi:hypothetical protein